MSIDEVREADILLHIVDISHTITKDKSTISGTVIDNETGEFLVGAIISIEGTDIKSYTDLNGHFSISGINSGDYSLIVSLISYKKSLIEDLKLNPSEKKVIDIKLDDI